MSTPGGEVWGLLVTYRRPDVAAATMESLRRQSTPVDHLVVVDNGSQPEVRTAAAAVGALYLDAGGNAGPAGGFALGMDHVLAHCGEDDWLLLVDDDDPPRSPDTLERLRHFAQRQMQVDPHTGGVGNGGSRYRRRTGTFARLEDEELQGPTRVDVLFGGSQPLYRCAAVRDVGTFDATLFWGFEEGHYGLRMVSAGWNLYIDGDAMLASRTATGAAGIASRSVRTPARKAAWRRYYSVRNSTLLARRHAAPWTPWYVAAGGAAKGVLALVRSRRPLREVALPVRGAADGLLERLGRRVDPGTNTKVH